MKTAKLRNYQENETCTSVKRESVNPPCLWPDDLQHQFTLWFESYQPGAY